MPALEIADHNQPVLFWPKTGDGVDGQPTHADEPTSFYVRWEPSRRQAIDPKGNVVALDAVVYTDRIMEIGSLIWLGEYADWVGSGSGVVDDERMIVINNTNIEDLKGRHTYFEAGCMRYKGKS